jgi:hypothetical protein
MLTQYTNPPMLVVAKTVLFLTSLAFSLSRSPKNSRSNFSRKNGQGISFGALSITFLSIVPKFIVAPDLTPENCTIAD